MKNKRFFAVACAVAAVALAGCAVPYRPDAADAQFASQLAPLNRPLSQPSRSFSSYSVALGCMDRLLRDMRMPTTLITSKNIPDPSGKVTVATKEMIITALSQMSRTSSAFRYVDYEVDLVRQDTVQNLTTLLLGANQLQLQRPALYVSGAISFADVNVASNDADVGTSASRLETGYSRNRNGTLIGLELHLGEFRTRTLIPGVDSANEVAITNAGWGLDVAGRIGKYGVQFNVGKEFSQGTSGAARTLVELGVIELVGKWSRVPYWQCLSLDQTHPDFQRTLMDWYRGESPEQMQKSVQAMLHSRGYLASPDVEGPQLKQAIVRFQADQDIVAHGQISFEMYERLMRDYVNIDTKGQFVRIGWEQRQTPALAKIRDALTSIEIPKAVTDVVASLLPDTVSNKPIDAAAQANRIEMKIENLPTPNNRMATSFEIGEQLFMSAVLAQTAHMWCYYEDALGATMRIYPNITHRHSLTQANRAIRLPDWMNPNPGFYIEATDPGNERVMCIAHPRDLLLDNKNPLMTSSAFQLLKGVSLEQIKKAYLETAADVTLVDAGVQWNVRRKGAPVATNSAPTPGRPVPSTPAATPTASPATPTSSVLTPMPLAVHTPIRADNTAQFVTDQSTASAQAVKKPALPSADLAERKAPLAAVQPSSVTPQALEKSAANDARQTVVASRRDE
ncbi:DUF4384 domain-containing protein [Variovorax sp. PCZ-1]|uniref:DUF4384 domain-containing protein n=1 Tax=Variovorax sp. PCZ-1 TaxID=2835533 RepID=UPI001BD1A7E3|nr:DUF4384 domain-containing protein [Variovorax sp. PCZ-1]MBS7808433.1 DUF4384 domain-containing protein [Variovorax sp. PCZ-1]